MKKIYSKISLLVLLVIIFVTACKNDDNQDAVKIDSVWSNQVDTLKLYGEQRQVTSMAVGKWVHLQGSGFTGLRKILCNGVSASFNTTYVTDSYVTFTIPSTTPVPGDSTITVITDHGEYTLKPFIFY